jgi:DNA-directed RNA polymerase subunit K/omega
VPDSKPFVHNLNKYEMVVVAAKEARRLNEMAHQQGRELKGRVTDLAMKRFLKGDVKFRYEETPAPPVQPPTT